jgi:putative transposase
MRWRFRAPEPVPIQVPGVNTSPTAVGRASYPATPDKLWAADLTAVPTTSGAIYVAAVLDCYSRHCLGWSTGERLRPELVIRAVRLATGCHRPALRSIVEPTPVAGEVALALGESCVAAGVAVVPGSSPSGVDGAVTTSFLRMLRRELVGTGVSLTRTDAAEAVASWITRTYNEDRIGIAPVFAG